MRRFRPLLVLTNVVALVTSSFFVGAASAASKPATIPYSAVVTVSPPPSGNFVGSGGGDGWGLGFTATEVFNVFHHAATLSLDCHLQSDASQCPTNGQLVWPVTVTDATGGNFAVEAQPSLWVDQATGRLYVYATQTATATAGVVCVDTNANVANPFCGFTALSAPGDAPLQSSISNVSNAVVSNGNFYAVNFTSSGSSIPGANKGTENTVMCFSLTTHKACAPSHFAFALGAGTVNVGAYPSPSITLVGSDLLIPFSTTAGNFVGCANTLTKTTCAGAWPVSVTDVPSSGGAGIPVLNAAGLAIGYCTRTTTECHSLSGATMPAPAGFPLSTGEGWIGSPVVVGTRVYVPASVGAGYGVDCYDFATHARCAHFPLSLANYNLAYSVTIDPNRLGCLWVNSDDGAGQIQNFDAYTGGGCGSSGERVLVSQFVAPAALCRPSVYQRLAVLSPLRSAYATGTVQFQDAGGNPLPGVPTLTLDKTGGVNLSSYKFSTTAALPQALITLSGAGVSGRPVTVQLSWQGVKAMECELEPSPAPSVHVSLVHNPDDSVTAHISWSLPLSDGNAAILRYLVSALPGGRTCASTKVLQCIITGLLANTNYTFAVTAINKVGSSTPTISSPASVSTKLRVSYNANRATSGSPPVDARSPYANASTVTVAGSSTLARSGYTFAGWNTNPTGTGTAYQPGATFVINHAMALYAQWTKDSAALVSTLGLSPSSLVETPLTLNVTGGAGSGALSYSLTNDATGGSCLLSGNVINSSDPGVCTVTVSKAASPGNPLSSLVIAVTFIGN